MERLGTAFTDTSRLHHRYHHLIFASFNLYSGQNRLFDKLKESEVISQTELAHRMNIAPATLTRMVQNMEKNGYVSRENDKKDQRVTLIHLTAKGIETRTMIGEKLRAMDQKIFKNFTIQEQKMLHNMLLRIQNQLLEEINIENNI